MVNKTIKYDVKYLKNCQYEASDFHGELELPSQNVDIKISMENISAIQRVGYNDVTRIDYQNNNKTYYNDTLKVTISVNIANMPLSIVDIGGLSINYLDENMKSKELFGVDIPLSKNGQVIFTFKPHYNGYIQVKYNDNSNFFNSNEQQSSLIVLDKIPINTETIANPTFLDYESETELICNVVDVYGNKLNYGHVVFLGYHDIPRDSLNPSAGQEVVLGNPVPVINGIAKLKYIPEQDIDVEYIVGHYNYYKEQYGSNFKYYEAHASHTHVSTIKRDTLNFTLGVLEGNNVVNSTIFDGFIHMHQGDTLRISTNLLDEDNNSITIKDDMEYKLHIEGTKHIINDNYSHSGAHNVEDWMEENVIFEEYKDEIDLNNNTIDINNIPSGYYNIYATFKDTDDKSDMNRIYYKDYMSDIFYIAIMQPNIIINPVLSYINPVANENNTYTAQVNDNLSVNLKATCSNVPNGMKGNFEIDGIKYKAKYLNNAFIPENPIKIDKAGDYYIHFSTEASYYANQGFYPVQSATPIILKIRNILEPVIEIPEGYVDNEYPGSIAYILSVKNWYDETGISITVKIKNTTTNTYIQTYTETYKGENIHKEINNLAPSSYQIEASIGNKSVTSAKHTISKQHLEGEVNELSGLNITSGIQTNIQYNIKSHKPILSKNIINNARMYAKQGQIIKYVNITDENITLNNDKNLISIYTPIILYLNGDWSIRFVQNPSNLDYNSDIFVPYDSNFNGFISEAKTFTVERVVPTITINKTSSNITVNIKNNGSSNNQILLFYIKVSYGEYNTVEIPVLTTRYNNVTIPLTSIHQDFESLLVRQQIYNIKVTLDPYNDELMDSINGESINNIKASILDEYENLYNTDYLDDFATQIKEDMLYTSLFATYEKTIKSERYGN